MFIKKEEKEQIQEQLASLVEYKEKQEETINALVNQNALLRESQEKQTQAFNSQIAVLEESRNQQNTMLQMLSNQNEELQKTNTAMIEQRDRNENILIEAVGKLTDVKKSAMVPYTDEQKRKAAYALNLCMVSISQIVDYDDLYVLDQEYDMVLNNLNLENMPKDEALLNILKQTLDTITYFRIQEGDKRFLEREYQHNIKNAVYDSVPRNLNILTCGESPWSIAISAALSLTCQIGTGYMNYRRNKANYNINREKQKWQLQRSAMEQFNGLRRDLFDTAWRLADEYHFADELRLTERQIDLYNEILDDQDDLRKYERLDIIKDAFEAYPPFWFFIGDTAARIATSSTTEKRLIEKFKSLAIMHFDKFISMSESNLLREDTLLSTCALEYVELLDMQKDADKIRKLLELAQKNDGNENDIIELISVAYMKIGDYMKASDTLRRLVNENYNVGINVQLLSSLYVQEYFNNPGAERKKEIEDLYTTLLDRTNGNNVFRLPKNSKESWNDINAEFVYMQQERIVELFYRMLEQLGKKYNILYNKLIPLDIRKNREYPDSWYVDEYMKTSAMTDRRYAEISKNIKKDDRFSIYCLMYNEETFSEKALAVLSDLAGCVTRYLSSITKIEDMNLDIGSNDYSTMQELNDYLIYSVKQHSAAFRFIDSAFANGNSQESFIVNLKEVNYYKIVGSYLVELDKRGSSNIRKMNNMNDLFAVESDIRSLCKDQEIRLFSQVKIDADEEVADMEIPLSAVYGEKAKEYIEDKLSNMNKREEILSIIKECEKDIVLNPDVTKFYTEQRDINQYVKRSKLAKKLVKINIISVIDDLSKQDKDLLLTLDGIYVIEKDRFSDYGEAFEYKDVQIYKSNYLSFIRQGRMHKTHYVNPAVDLVKMHALFMDIATML